MMHNRAWRPAVLAALIPLALSAGPAFAAPATATSDDQAHHMTVQFGDLDLSSAKGRHVLDRRLRQTAATVCGYNEADSRELINGQRACYDTAMQNAHVAVATKLSESRMASSR